MGGVLSTARENPAGMSPPSRSTEGRPSQLAGQDVRPGQQVPSPSAGSVSPLSNPAPKTLKEHDVRPTPLNVESTGQGSQGAEQAFGSTDGVLELGGFDDVLGQLDEKYSELQKDKDFLLLRRDQSSCHPNMHSSAKQLDERYVEHRNAVTLAELGPNSITLTKHRLPAAAHGEVASLASLAAHNGLMNAPIDALFHPASGPLAHHLNFDSQGAIDGSDAATQRSSERSPSFDQNMRWAIEAISHTRLLVPNSANMHYTSSPTKSSSGKVIGSATEDYHKKMLFRCLLEQQKAEPIKTTLDRLKIVERVSLEFKEGTCPQLAYISAIYLKENQDSPINIIRITDDATENLLIPHILLVIGLAETDKRPDDSNLGLPDTWHEDAVICDPWDKAAYPAGDYNKYWDNIRNHQADKTKDLKVEDLGAV
ncbi:MAG: hypothetical protein ACR2Q4_10980 [Geminicoccaceae bacterium]